jgi:TPR repeat protein
VSGAVFVTVPLAFCLISGVQKNSVPRIEPEQVSFQDGLDAIVRRDYPAAINDFTMAANNGNSDAAFNLSLMYYYGQGNVSSYAKSAFWTIKAAHEGNIRAEFNAIWAYANGDGVAQDDNTSDYWRQKVASANYDDEFDLSGMYSNGSDGVYDHASAIAWTRYAA